MAEKGKSKGKAGGKDDGEILVCRNAKATQRYEIEERLEAGMVLVGSEVKSLRARQGDLDGAYASLDRGELWLHKMHIAPYVKATAFAHETRRSRKLLAHRHELQKLDGRLTMRGYTLIPLRVYFKNGHAKVELGLAKAKSVGDNREKISRELDKREAREAMGRGRGGGKR